MAVFKLNIDDMDEVDFNLIAIHSTMDDYRLAYLLNKHLDILLTKSKDPLVIRAKGGVGLFDRFQYEKADLDIRWNLITNWFESDPVLYEDSINLFANTMTSAGTKIYLVPELRKVDYFLKIENHDCNIAELVSKLNKIDRIATAYLVDHSKIKSQNNLIF